MYCSRCGKEIDDNAAFCKHCGAPTGAMTPAVGSANVEKMGKKPIIITAIVCIAVICITVLIVNVVNSNKKSSSDRKEQATTLYEMDHSTYCLLYMEVSHVTVSHRGDYAYISGTITNAGDYQIKYVKVKASCKDSRGSIIDTDWTYAVDSSWLDPGESKQFEMMVKDTSGKIKTAVVTVVCE